MICSFAELKKTASNLGGFTIAVAAPDSAAMQAVAAARREGIAESILVGDASQIAQLAEENGISGDDYRVLHCDSKEGCGTEAVRLARRGEANILMKGRVPSSVLLRAAFDREHGLRTGRLLSDVRLYEHPFQQQGFLGISDGGVNPAPTQEQKLEIIQNAVTVYHRLGCEQPKVALLCAYEKVTAAMPHTQEAKNLADYNRSGGLKGALVDGPLSLDLAVIQEAVTTKGFDSPVAGGAHILVGPTIEVSNILAKALVYFGGLVPGQVVMGAKVPLLIPSRADSSEAKLNSVALAAVVAGAERKA